MRDYPAGWRVVPLADTGKWLSGGTPPTTNARYWGGDVPWISAASLKEFRITNSDRKITRLGAAAGTRLVSENTILFVIRGMSLKSEFRVGITKSEMAFGQDCKAIIATPEINPAFLAHALRAGESQILSMVDEAGHGTGRLPTDQLAAMRIGIPDLPEQRRIVEILDSVDDSIRSLEHLFAKLESTRNAVLTGFFLPKRGRTLTLGQVCRITSGSTPSRSVAAFWNGGTIPWVKTAEVQFSVILDTEEYLTQTAVYAARLRVYPSKTVFVAMYGQGATRGRVGILGVPAAANQACAALQCDPQLMRQEFLYHQLSLSYDRLRRLGHGSQQTNLNAELLAELPIVVPRLSEQDRILGHICQWDTRIRSESDSLRKLRSLKRGLMEDLLTGRVRVKVGKDVAA